MPAPLRGLGMAPVGGSFAVGGGSGADSVGSDFAGSGFWGSGFDSAWRTCSAMVSMLVM
jgi:hypothetical protein